MLTIEEVRDLVPKKKRNLVSEELIDRINQVAAEPLIADQFKENFITYSNIMQTGKYSIDEYKNAVHFVTHLLLESKDIDAYKRVFPDRYKRLEENGLDRSSISPYATAYKKSKLVTSLLEQTLTPSYIVNAPLYQQALNVQVELMMTARSEMVRTTAASAVLTHLKPPEAAKLEVDVNINKGSIVDDYEKVMRELAAQKMAMIKDGGDVKSIANFDIKPDAIEAEIEEK